MRPRPARTEAAAGPRLFYMGKAPASPLRRSLLLGAGAALAGCASAPDEPGHDWHEVRLPGRAVTR